MQPMAATSSCAQPQTVSKAKRGIVLGLVLLIVVAGYGAWKFFGIQNPKSQDSQSGSVSTKATGGLPEIEDKVVKEGEAFIGRWFPENKPGMEEGIILTFSRQGSKIVGVSTKDPEGRIELDPAPGDRLSGAYVGPDGKRIPMTAEMLSDRQKMVLTLLPPASEPDTVILWRVKDDEIPAKKGAGQSELSTSAEVDQDRAAEIVSRLPDVDNFLKRLSAVGKRAHIDTTEEDPQTWMVHVYEIVDDGDGMSHTATFGWFKVDKKTGRVSPGME